MTTSPAKAYADHYRAAAERGDVAAQLGLANALTDAQRADGWRRYEKFKDQLTAAARA